MLISLEIKINFLDVIIIPSFGLRYPLENEEIRQNWMRNRVQTKFSNIFNLDDLEELFILFNTINTLEKAEYERNRLEEKERQFILQQQQQQANVLKHDPKYEELDRKISLLQIDMVSMKTKPMPKGPTTQAKFAQDLKTENRLKYDSNFHQLLQNHKVDWWPAKLTPEGEYEPPPDLIQFPVLHSTETATCQPFVNEIISDLGEKMGYRIMKNYVQGSNSQKYFINPTNLKNILKNDVITSPTKPTFRSRKPDIVAYLPNKRGGCAITIIGEVKERSSDNDFPDAEVGQILETAMELLAEEQLLRPFIYCFLTDGFRFQFFKCFRDSNNDFEFLYSMIFLGEIGWQIFFGLLTLNKEQLGLQVIDFDGYEIINGLGIGRFSCVYRCRDETTNAYVVLKYFTSDYLGMGNQEFTYLQQFSQRGIINVPIVSKALATENSYMLVITPVGIPVIPSAYNFTPRMMIDLLEVLKKIHSINLIHRDVKPDNIYFDSNNPNRIILNDWSSATNSGIACQYQGTPFFGEPKVESHIPTIQLDLKCLVKTIFFISHQKNYPNIDFNNYTEITNYWDGLKIDYPQFATVMNVAEIGNYQELEKILNLMW